MLGENVCKVHAVTRTICDFSDPPSKLSVTGYDEGTTIVAGTVLKLMCTATAGNPLATLTWYKNDRKVGEIVGRAIVGTTVSSSFSVENCLVENWIHFSKLRALFRIMALTPSETLSIRDLGRGEKNVFIDRFRWRI